MNNDETDRQKRPQISAELERRVLAWISGEASASEAAEMEKLSAANPELSALVARMEAMRKLVAEALAPDGEVKRLAESRRAALLHSLATPNESAAIGSAESTDPVPFVPKRRRERTERPWVLAIAACLASGLFLSAVIRFSLRQRPAAIAYRESANSLAAGKSLPEPMAPDNSKPPQSVVAAAGAGPVGEFRSQETNRLQSRAGQINDDLNQAKDQPATAVAAAAVPSAAPANRAFERRSGAIGGFGGGGKAARANDVAAADSNAAEFPPPVQLQPFEVRGDQARGYFTPNTTAGSRLNNNIGDIPSAVTVIDKSELDKSLKTEIARNAAPSATNVEAVETDRSPNSLMFGSGSAAKAEIARNPATGSANSLSVAFGSAGPVAGISPSVAVVDKQQLQDTNAQNINDIMVYEAGTSGSHTFDAFAGANATNPIGNRPTFDEALSSGFGKTLTLAAEGQVINREPSLEPSAGNPAGTHSLGYVQPASPASGGSALQETATAAEPVSTFSLHVSDASFRLAREALARGAVPAPESIRPEEFYNAFNYGDPAPAMADKISSRIEQAADPVRQQRNFLRIAMRVPTTGREATQPLRLTVLLDTSGSMEREDRAATVRRAMQVLVSLLGPQDRLTLIGFARQPRLLAEQVPGDQASRLLGLIARTPAEGGTNLEEALRLGGELAHRHYLAAAQNRVVLLTDGAANLGDADPAHLAARIETLRQEGIAFDACGVGTGGIDDTILETLTRKGSGRYYVLDSPAEADAGFARQLAGAFRPAAENVKVQVRFNPARVGRYRLIGFDQHRLNEQDFHNDQVAAAALATGEAGVALYDIEVLPQGDGELGEVSVRFRDAATGGMVERSWTLAYDPSVPAFDRATPTMQLAGAAALLAEKLRGGATGASIRLAPLAPVMNALRGHYADDARVQELVTMYEQLRRLDGE